MAALSLVAASAFACTNYVGRINVSGNSTTTGTVTTDGFQCADDVGSGNPVCTQGMTENNSSGIAKTKGTGGTVSFTTAVAGGTVCSSLSGSPVCHLNDSASINFPSGNTGYDVSFIQVGYSTHTSNPGSNQDCMTWAGNPNGATKVATVSVAGGAGVLSGASSFNGHTASFNSTTHTATVSLPTLSLSTGTQEGGLCVSDTKGEDGIQAPVKIVTS